MSRYARRRDANHAALVKALEALGCSVLDTAHIGIPGAPDVICGALGSTYCVEFKNPDSRYGRAGLNDNQQAFARDWRGGPLYAVSTPEECAVLVGNWRRAARLRGGPDAFRDEQA